MSNFYEFLQKKEGDVVDKAQPCETIVQDQDTVVGDAMCHASQMIYDVAHEIATCINEGNQEAIPMEKLREAERALCYMEGVDFGLAMDDKSMKWYMTELEKCIASIERSKEEGFQTQIYVPSVKPCDLFGFDEDHARAHKKMFLAIDFKKPSRGYVEARKKELAEDENFKYLFDKGVLSIRDFPVRQEFAEEPDKDTGKQRDTEDDAPNVLMLRNLFRQGKIGKSQYVGALATMLATGLISKGDFTRLKMAAN